MTSAENSSTAPPATPSIDAGEVAKFSAIAAEWWDPKGKFRPLHKFNPVRLAFIKETICSHFDHDLAAPRPLDGLRLLDIGCGGGLVSEPMSRLGADVVGVDASVENIKTASVHARSNNLDIDYRAGTAEGLIGTGEDLFDVVLNLEVVEHTADAESFIADCSRLVAPGGLMIVATINRTPKAFALAIVGAEYVLGWLPRGTHEFSKLVQPDEIERAASDGGLASDRAQGVSFNPLLDKWSLTRDTAVNYMMVCRRPR